VFVYYIRDVIFKKSERIRLVLGTS